MPELSRETDSNIKSQSQNAVCVLADLCIERGYLKYHVLQVLSPAHKA